MTYSHAARRECCTITCDESLLPAYYDHALCALSDETAERARDGVLEKARIRARGEKHPRRVRVIWGGEGRARREIAELGGRDPGWDEPPSTA